jgi:hypothetical protein
MRWHSAGDLGLYEDTEVQPWERTAPAPPRSDRRDESDHDDDRRTRGSVFLAAEYYESQSPRVCVSARISPSEK